MRSRAYVVYAGLALTVLILLNLPTRASRGLRAAVQDALTPFQNLATHIASSFHDLSNITHQSLRFSDERRRLMEENANLRLQLQLRQDLERDNATLRRLLGFQSRSHYRLILCDVVARGDAGGWWQTLRLNRGAEAGIEPDLAVITPEGLVGRITTVSKLSCDVLLITDPKCKIAAKLAGDGSFGIVQGAGVSFKGPRDLTMLLSAPSLRMDYLHRDAIIEKGAEVVTSEKSGVYPEGLPVGRVTSVAMDGSRLFRRADIVPAADLANLRFAFVILTDRAAHGAASEPEGQPATDSDLAEETLP